VTRVRSDDRCDEVNLGSIDAESLTTEVPSRDEDAKASIFYMRAFEACPNVSMLDRRRGRSSLAHSKAAISILLLISSTSRVAYVSVQQLDRSRAQ
jgi:hypothetical protein